MYVLIIGRDISNFIFIHSRHEIDDTQSAIYSYVLT